MDDLAEPFDVMTMGRVGIDLYPVQAGRPLEDVETFSKSVGGSATNVAVAAARHGLQTSVVTAVGEDPFGRYVKREVGRLGVDPSFILATDEAKTPLTFCEIFPPDDFPLYFYREPVAPDLLLRPDSIPLEAIGRARLFWATVTGLSRSPSREAHHAAWAVRERDQHTVLDLDYRASLWSSEDDAREQVGRALERVSVAVGNSAECEIAVGESDPMRAVDALLERGVRLAVVKLGPRGVLAKSRDEYVQIPAAAVDVVNGLGAGDGFGGALCLGLLSGWPLERLLRFANAAGAIVATRRECSTAMPTTAEVDKMLESVSA